MQPPVASSLSCPALSTRRELWLLLTLAGVQFTHILDFMIMMPLGPQFTALFGITDAQFGLLVSAYTWAAAVSGLLASTFIDRFGRKKLLLVLYGLFAVATLACGLAHSYGWLMVARIAAGGFGGILAALSQTIVGDVIPFERRGRAMGIVMTSFSLSTVAGVPLGLLLAAHFSWHAPFFVIAAFCVLLAVLAALSLPALEGHLQGGRRAVWRDLAQVLGDANHRQAFVFSALMMFTGTAVIPYITLFLQTNAGVSADQVPYLYLCGGVVTLFTARLFGRLADRHGKVQVYSCLALAATLPVMGITQVAGWPLPWVMVVTTAFFMLVSGRMVPGMALLTAAAQPQLRGTFMTLNAAVQSATMGLAAFVGGHLISRNAQGLIQGYWRPAVLGVVASLLSIWLARRLVLHGIAPAPAADAPVRL